MIFSGSGSLHIQDCGHAGVQCQGRQDESWPNGDLESAPDIGFVFVSHVGTLQQPNVAVEKRHILSM